MNCPRCDTEISAHEAGTCLDLWILETVLGWKTSISPYTGNFYPEGSYFVSWISPDGNAYLITQAFDKNGKNLRAIEHNPFGLMYEFVEHGKTYQFSTDISAAWDVVENMRKRHILLPI